MQIEHTTEPQQFYDTSGITSYGVKVLWLLFTLFIFYGALIPFNFVFDNNLIADKIRNFNWMPFVEADGSRHSFPDIVQNILFFIPFGFLGVLSFAKNKFFAVFLVTFFGFVISLNIEILQLLTENRNTTVTDLVCNTIGGAIGAVAAFILFGIFCLLMKSASFQRTFNNKFYYLFVFSFLVIAASSLQPFDFTLDVGAVWDNVKGVMENPGQLTISFTDEFVVGFRFFLFAVITALWLRSINNVLWPIAGILLSASVGVFFELSQFIVSSRSPSIQDLIVVILGCSFGGVFALLVPKKIAPIVWIVPMIMITLMTAAVQTLAPFEMRLAHLTMGMVPFLSYYESSTFTAIANFLEGMITYMPLGFILQYAISRRRSAFILIVIIVAGLAYGLEYAQGWVEGRYPDITDVIGAVIGAVIAGSLCLRWSRVFEQDRQIPNEDSEETLVT
ncbi:MAG: VanZ family protein [Gammaproteobacteria bacterium]